MTTEEHTRFRSLDGLELAGTLTRPASPGGAAAVLVHGGGANRDESGFFTRLADGLASVGITALRFDLRGHGESGGRQEDLTICGVANDIHAAVTHARKKTGDEAAHLYGTSFSGGISAFFAARHPSQLLSLTLANPLLNYKKRFVEDKPYWHDDEIGDDAGRMLAENGFVEHSPTFRLGRPLLNEVFYVEPHKAIPDLMVPTLFIHGTSDTFIPVGSSRAAVTQITQAETRLVEIDGAQHGFAVHDDPQYLHPQTQAWQAFVIGTVADWMTGGYQGS